MKVDRQVTKQTEITLKHLAKDIRKGQVDSAKVASYSKLIGDYCGLIKMSREDEGGSNYYDQMEAEAFADINSRRQEVQKCPTN